MAAAVISTIPPQFTLAIPPGDSEDPDRLATNQLRFVAAAAIIFGKMATRADFNKKVVSHIIHCFVHGTEHPTQGWGGCVISYKVTPIKHLRMVTSKSLSINPTLRKQAAAAILVLRTLLLNLAIPVPVEQQNSLAGIFPEIPQSEIRTSDDYTSTGFVARMSARFYSYLVLSWIVEYNTGRFNDALYNKATEDGDVIPDDIIFETSVIAPRIMIHQIREAYASASENEKVGNFWVLLRTFMDYANTWRASARGLISNSRAKRLSAKYATVEVVLDLLELTPDVFRSLDEVLNYLNRKVYSGMANYADYQTLLAKIGGTTSPHFDFKVIEQRLYTSGGPERYSDFMIDRHIDNEASLRNLILASSDSSEDIKAGISSFLNKINDQIFIAQLKNAMIAVAALDWLDRSIQGELPEKIATVARDYRSFLSRRWIPKVVENYGVAFRRLLFPIKRRLGNYADKRSRETAEFDFDTEAIRAFDPKIVDKINQIISGNETDVRAILKDVFDNDAFQNTPVYRLISDIEKLHFPSTPEDQRDEWITIADLCVYELMTGDRSNYNKFKQTLSKTYDTIKTYEEAKRTGRLNASQLSENFYNMLRILHEAGTLLIRNARLTEMQIDATTLNRIKDPQFERNLMAQFDIIGNNGWKDIYDASFDDETVLGALGWRTEFERLFVKYVPQEPSGAEGEMGGMEGPAAPSPGTQPRRIPPVTYGRFENEAVGKGEGDFSTYPESVNVRMRSIESYRDSTTGALPRQRPADQLAAAMLGTACEGDERAPGCYATKDITTAKCNPENVITGECNFKTIAVPHENPVGNSSVHRVYRALDIGAQIKLQLQRALIRYGFAAAIIPIYSYRVVDRHFSTIPQYQSFTDAVDGKKPEYSNTYKMARDPVYLKNSEVASKSRDWYGRGIVEMIQRFSIYHNDKSPAEVILPHYSRFVPQEDEVPPDIIGALETSPELKNTYSEAGSSSNRFIHIPGTAAGFYVPFPIWTMEGGKPFANPAYVNERFRNDPGKMLRKGIGILHRAMQHLRNALLLYIIAGKTNVERFGQEGLQKLGDTLGSGYKDLLEGDVIRVDKISIPRGALAFLNTADINAIKALGLYLASIVDTATSSEQALVRDKLFLNPIPPLDPKEIAAPRPYKPEARSIADYTQVTLEIMTKVAYFETLWSYWYDNNAMSRVRRRVNVKAKRATPQLAVNQAAMNLRDMRERITPQITAEFIKPVGWGDAALAGLVLARIVALRGQTGPTGSESMEESPSSL